MAAAWTPSSAYIERSRLRAFAMKNGCTDYAALLRWSTEDLEGFWASMVEFFDVQFARPAERVLGKQTRVEVRFRGGDSRVA